VQTVQGISSMTPFIVSQATAANLNATVAGTGTFATQSAITAASGSIASGAIASGAVASGAIASGAYAAGSIASGAAVSGAFADGSLVTLGAKADAKSTATDTTAVTIMQVMKEISAMEQAPVSRAVTNAGTFATQSAITAASGSIASGAVASGAFASGSVASGAFASGSLAAGSMVDLLTMRAPIGGTTSSPADVLVGGCQYNSGAQTYTTGDSGAIQCTINGYPIVQVNNTNANITPADTASNPTTTSPIVGFNEVWNGSTWDRMPGSAAAGATVSPASTYVSGKLISSLVKGTTAAMTGTTSTQLLAAVSGKVIYVMNVDCVNSSTTATLVTLQDGSAGTALGTVAAAASGGGHAIHATFPETWTTSGNGLYVADVTTGASVICTASGFAQ
jgi:hypothetical protein